VPRCGRNRDAANEQNIEAVFQWLKKTPKLPIKLLNQGLPYHNPEFE